MNNIIKPLSWIIFALLSAFSLGYLALNRGEQINALWIVIAAVYIYLIAYHYYSCYIAHQVLSVDPNRIDIRYNDGLNYASTNKKIACSFQAIIIYKKQRLNYLLRG